jgi:polysaccharide export outer membrane protein
LGEAYPDLNFFMHFIQAMNSKKRSGPLYSKFSSFSLRGCFLTIIIVPFLFSCVNQKSAIYFNNMKDSTIVVEVENLEPVIQKNDLLSIHVTSLNQELTEIFNVPNTSVAQAPGYLVSQDGLIQFPLLGNLRAAGLTKKQLKDQISKSLVDKKLLLLPIVDVRYLNYRVTVIGEVAHPLVITVTGEKISLLEAIGYAGDLSLGAKRNNVMVIRDEEGKRTVKRINLNNSELFTSPYYYLKSNDVVYVEAGNAKISSNSKTYQWLPLVISTLTLGVLIVDHINR